MNTLDTSMHGRSLWLRSTDEKGRATYSEHRVWDAARFMTVRQAEAGRLNDKHECMVARADEITPDQHRKATQ
jgi:hypothetical protein